MVGVPSIDRGCYAVAREEGGWVEVPKWVVVVEAVVAVVGVAVARHRGNRSCTGVLLE